MQKLKNRKLGKAIALIKTDSFGYTLLEMLIVVLVLSIIVGVSIPYAVNFVAKSREESDISAIQRACAKYEANYYIDGVIIPLINGGDVEDFVNSVITSEHIDLNYNNDGSFGAMPIKVENGFAYITYRPRHSNGKQLYNWRLKLTNVSFEDEARAPGWTPPVPIIPEPADP